jgi:two-component system OmpR family response regulator
MKVLLVEDENMLREFLCETMLESGLDTTSVGNGLSAIRACTQTRFDVVVLDLMLPDMDGFEVLTAIRGRKENPPPRVIVFSGRGDREAHQKADMLDVDEYLSKPFDPHHLAMRVRAVANRITTLRECQQ